MEKDFMRLIDGFPRVIERWLSETHRKTMESVGDLKRVATDGQRFRYGARRSDPAKDTYPLHPSTDYDRRAPQGGQ